MLLVIVRLIYAFVCAGVFASYVSNSAEDGIQVVPTIIATYPWQAFLVLMSITQIITLGDILIPRKKLDMISAVYFGLLIGIFLSYLLNLALDPIVGVGTWAPLVRWMTFLILPYVCITLLLQTKDDFRFVIPYVEFSKEVKGNRPMLLDTSSIIDGRIADLVETKVFDSELVVPTFILQELQDIADSGDKLRRNRGRRGLDVLNRLRNSPHVEVRLHETDDDSKEFRAMTVDQRLVALAKDLGGKVITNDFNLNKVASVQGVDVINLNDVSNSLRPRYLPGEHVNIKIIRPGEAPGQGVGYLDDGTMVVCEQGSALIGKDASVTVTSVLQNSAGRMIFGKLDSASPSQA